MLDDWQAWLVEQLLAERVDGSLAASQACIIVPRQNGKNVVLAAVELYGLCVAGLRRQVHSAHLTDTASEHLKFLKDIIEGDPDLDAVLQIYESNGKERIVNRETRGELSFNTRSKNTKRGASPQRIVFDEALVLTDAVLGSMVPSMAAQSMNVDTAPQAIFTSSAPLLDSEVLHRLRSIGRDGGAPRMLLAAWECAKDVDPDDREAWYAANPGLGVRISEEYVETMERAIMSDADFLRERLGVVFEPTSERRRVWTGPQWSANVDDGSEFVRPEAFGVHVSSDRMTAAIGFASTLPDGRVHVGVMDHRPGQGLGWVRDRVAEIRANAPGAPIALNPRSDAGSFVVDLEAGGELVKTTAPEYASACGEMFDAVLERRVRYRRQRALDDAVDAVGWRPLAGGRAWDGDEEIVPLVAVTLALHAVRTHVPAVEAFAIVL